ncbi:deoxyribodipyrimidine photolyase [Rhodococcus erythropolis]
MTTQLLAATDSIEAAGFILSGVKGIFYLIGGVIAAILCGFIGKAKGYSALLFAVLGFFFSIITLIVVLIIPKKS